MKPLATQFETGRMASAVATPTCSSCCCCCCCLATTAVSTTLLAQRVSREGQRNDVRYKTLHTVLAVLVVPVALLLWGLLWLAIEGIMAALPDGTCDRVQFDPYGSCQPIYEASWVVVGVLAPVLVVWFLFARVRVSRPFRSAAIVTLVTVVAFALEFAAGAGFILVTQGGGAFVYLLLVPFIVYGALKWQSKRQARDANPDAA